MSELRPKMTALFTLTHIVSLLIGLIYGRNFGSHTLKYYQTGSVVNKTKNSINTLHTHTNMYRYTHLYIYIGVYILIKKTVKLT